MDSFDRQRPSLVYQTLVEILERERDIDRVGDHLSYTLGDLTRRVFVGAKYLPPDELLEEVAKLLRNGEPDDLRRMGKRLHDHAQQLFGLTSDALRD